SALPPSPPRPQPCNGSGRAVRHLIERNASGWLVSFATPAEPKPFDLVLPQGYQPEGVPMRIILPFLAALAIIASTAASSVPAQADSYRWCANYGRGNGGRNCGFNTFAQCQAALSGNGGFCERNARSYDRRR